MPLTNLNSAHLSAAQVTAAKAAVAELENALSAVNVTLTSEERQRYGSINEQNKLLVNKVNDYHKSNPGLSVADVDWDEFERDLKSREVLDSLITSLEAMVTKLKNAKTLHDYDNYQAALSDYAYSGYRAGTGADGYETKFNEMKQFFVRSGKNTNSNPEST